MELHEFMDKVLNEDEEVAMAAAQWGAKWRVYSRYSSIDGIIVDEPFENSWDRTCITHDAEGIMPSVDEDAAPHIARFDPARILAEVTAKRAVIRENGGHIIRDDMFDSYESIGYHHVRVTVQKGKYLYQGSAFNPGVYETLTWDEFVEKYTMPNITLRALALPYSSHPDYNPDWSL